MAKRLVDEAMVEKSVVVVASVRDARVAAMLVLKREVEVALVVVEDRAVTS